MRKPRPATASNPLPRLDQVMFALAAGSAAGLVGCAAEQPAGTLVAFEPSGGETVHVVQVVQPPPPTTVVGTTTYVVQPPPPETVLVRRFAQPPPQPPQPPQPPIGPIPPVPLAGAPMPVGPSPVPVPHPPRPTTVPAPHRRPAQPTPPVPEMTGGGMPSVTLAPVPAAHARTLGSRRA